MLVLNLTVMHVLRRLPGESRVFATAIDAIAAVATAPRLAASLYLLLLLRVLRPIPRSNAVEVHRISISSSSMGKCIVLVLF